MSFYSKINIVVSLTCTTNHYAAFTIEAKRLPQFHHLNRCYFSIQKELIVNTKMSIFE